jgi:hypothetical protein
MHNMRVLLLLSLLGLTGTVASAADLPAKSPPAPPTIDATPWLFALEFYPEFYAINQDPHDSRLGKPSKKPANGIDDYYGKANLSYTFDNNWVVTGSLQGQIKKNKDANGNFTADSYEYYAEATVGYKFNWSHFTLTPSAGLGYTWGATGIYGHTAGVTNRDAAYYVAYLAGDWKLNASWTWNVFNLRFRDAFNYVWVTPKASTGITYNITAHDAVYITGGYAWKELDKSGQQSKPPFNPLFGNLDPDKWSIGVGYKHAF